MNLLICEKCKRNLIDRYFDKCMYCSHPIPEGQRLSKIEKETIKAKKEQQAEEHRSEHEQFMAKHKESVRRTGDDIGIEDLGSDFGGGNE